MEEDQPGLTRTPTYGRCFGSLFLGLSPFLLLMAVSALFGADTVTFNGTNTHGIGAIVVTLLLGIVFAAILAGLQKFGYLVLDFIHGMRAKG